MSMKLSIHTKQQHSQNFRTSSCVYLDLSSRASFLKQSEFPSKHSSMCAMGVGTTLSVSTALFTLFLIFLVRREAWINDTEIMKYLSIQYLYITVFVYIRNNGYRQVYLSQIQSLVYHAVQQGYQVGFPCQAQGKLYINPALKK